MARIRTVKPEIWTSEAFTECSVSARLLFIGALNFANDYGVLSDSAKRLKMQVFPADSFPVEPLIDELVANGLWERATHPELGKPILLIKGFSEHQVVNRPTGGEFGNPTEWHEPSHTTPTPLTEDSVSAHPRKGREGKGREETLSSDPDGSNTPAEAKPIPYEVDFDAAWAHYPRKDQRKAALRSYQARRRAGVAADQLLEATKAYAEQMNIEGRFREHIKLGSTFYGPDEHWLEAIKPPHESSPTAPTGDIGPIPVVPPIWEGHDVPEPELKPVDLDEIRARFPESIQNRITRRGERATA